MDNIEAIILVYRQILDGFRELQKYAIDGQQESTNTGRPNMAMMENLGLEGEKLMEAYKDTIIEFESYIDPPRLRPQAVNLKTIAKFAGRGCNEPKKTE